MIRKASSSFHATSILLGSGLLFFFALTGVFLRPQPTHAQTENSASQRYPGTEASAGLERESQGAEQALVADACHSHAKSQRVANGKKKQLFTTLTKKRRFTDPPRTAEASQPVSKVSDPEGRPVPPPVMVICAAESANGSRPRAP